jgi:hypothetical protein
MIGRIQLSSSGYGLVAKAPHRPRSCLPGVLLVLVFVGLPAGASLWAQEQSLPPVAPATSAASQPTSVPPFAPPPTPAPAASPAPPVPAQPPQPSDFRPSVFFTGVQRAAQRFQFTIAPDTPVKELLPVAPVAKDSDGAVRAPTLADVPEVDFQAPLARGLASAEAQKQTAHMIAKVNHVNAKQTDAFMDALRGARPDLAGLPFMMGDDCRIKGDRSRELTRAVATVRNALRGRAMTRDTVVFKAPPAPAPAPPSPAGDPAVQQPVPPTTPSPLSPAAPQRAIGFGAGAVSATFTGAVAADRVTPARFWEQYAAACAQEDNQVSAVDRARQENVLLARVAALMQVLAPEAPDLRVGLVKYLAAVSHVEATRALVRLAVYSEEDEVRLAAIAALKVRRERDYTDILLSGLRYPWPAVARQAAEAVVKLERTDLVPQLVELLEERDPRAPVAKTANGRRVHEARELVRVNHHRNCLLCHVPGNTAGVSPETLTAAVPVPSDPLPSSSDGYQQTSPDLSVRIDVTYLRQDFSLMQPVTDASPWPEMQRFDFLVRTRVLTEDEAAAREKLVASEPGRPSPYHRAVLAALRNLTGRDAAPTADAWRTLLNLPTAARQAARAP